MKNLTTEQQIEKLEKKASKINLKIEVLKSDQKHEERKKAFDLIMELGKEHNLFLDVTQEFEVGFGYERLKFNITMMSPTEVIKHEC